MDDVFRGLIAVLYYLPSVYLLYTLWKLRGSGQSYSNPALVTFWMIFTVFTFLGGAGFNEPILEDAGETINGLLNILILLGFIWPLWDILRNNQKQTWKAALPLISIAILMPFWDGRGLLAMEWWYLAPQGFTIPIIYWFWPKGGEVVLQTPDEKKKLWLQLGGIVLFFVVVLIISTYLFNR
jgi:hypothetical protein